MRNYFLLFFVIFTFQSIFAQQIDSIITLPAALQESSGLIYFNQKLITHTDSGGENALYELDTTSGQILRTVYIENTSNIDWEDIAQDQDFIYIADFGNNQGNRTNLKIYIVDKIDYSNTPNDSVSASVINFSYEDQTNFTSQNQNTNFDAEALLVKGDSLYIFTKNWVNQETNLYRLPKTTGTFSAENIGNFNINGLVTGASINEESYQILLCGYTKFGNSFLFEMKGFDSNSFFSGTNTRTSISPKGSVQIEGICFAQGNKHFMSSELFFTAPSVLHQIIDTTSTLIIDNISSLQLVEMEKIFFPNPVKNHIIVDAKYDKLKFFNTQAKLILETNQNKIDVKDWGAGIYFIHCYKQNELIKIVKFEKL